MRTTSTITAARAAIVSALRATGDIHGDAYYLEQVLLVASVTLILDDISVHMEQCATGRNRFAKNTASASDRAAYVREVMKYDRIGTAAKWLSGAVRALNQHDDEADAELLAAEALRELGMLEKADAAE